MEKKKHLIARLILLVLLCFGTSLVPTSCGSDRRVYL